MTVDDDKMQKENNTTKTVVENNFESNTIYIHTQSALAVRVEQRDANETILAPEYKMIKENNSTKLQNQIS